MEEGFTRREKIVGLFLLVMVIMTKVTLLVIARGQGWFVSQKTYYVKFDQGYNLHAGSLVKMFNTEIGKVSKLDISREEGEQVVQQQVVVTVKVLTEYAHLIHLNSWAEVVSPTLIGSEYLSITPGAPGSPERKEYEIIPSKEHKSMSQNLNDLVNEKTIDQIRGALDNITNMAQQFKKDEKAILDAVDSFKLVWVNLTEAKGTLGQLLMERDFYNRMNQSVTELNKVIIEAQKITGDLKPTSQNLQDFSKSLNQHSETLKSILADIKAGTPEFPRLMDNATEATRGGKEVVDAVKANPLIRMTLPQKPASQPLHVEPRHVP